jgi:hypothetical protein
MYKNCFHVLQFTPRAEIDAPAEDTANESHVGGS